MGRSTLRFTPRPTALVCPPHTPAWSWIWANRFWERPATEAAQVPGHSPLYTTATVPRPPAQPIPHHSLAPHLQHTPQRAWQQSYTAKTRKQPKRPAIENWLKKVCVCTHTHTHTHTGISVTKRNGILLFATIWMELENTILSDVKNYMISLICEI